MFRSNVTRLAFTAILAVSALNAQARQPEQPVARNFPVATALDSGATATASVAEQDSRIIYVSDSTGDDNTGKVYPSAAPEIGPDPREPEGAIKPFKTFTAAYRHVRDGKPDWVLVKRGKNFHGFRAEYLPTPMCASVSGS